jgi:hypothetical protein
MLYGLSNIGMAFSFTAMFAHMVHRNLLQTPLESSAGRNAIRRFGLGTLAYPAATVAGLIWPPLMLLALSLLAIYYATERTPSEPS